MQYAAMLMIILCLASSAMTVYSINRVIYEYNSKGSPMHRDSKAYSPRRLRVNSTESSLGNAPIFR